MDRRRQKGNIRTYGQHRYRRAVTTDWAKEKVFDSSSQNFSSCLLSREESQLSREEKSEKLKFGILCRETNYNLRSHLRNADHATGKVKTKRQKELFGESLSTTSESSAVSSSSDSHITKKAPKHATNDAQKSISAHNFSEFEDYSLVVSTSVTADKGGERREEELQNALQAEQLKINSHAATPLIPRLVAKGQSCSTPISVFIEPKIKECAEALEELDLSAVPVEDEVSDFIVDSSIVCKESENNQKYFAANNSASLFGSEDVFLAENFTNSNNKQQSAEKHEVEADKLDDTELYELTDDHQVDDGQLATSRSNKQLCGSAISSDSNKGQSSKRHEVAADELDDTKLYELTNHDQVDDAHLTASSSRNAKGPTKGFGEKSEEVISKSSHMLVNLEHETSSIKVSGKSDSQETNPKEHGKDISVTDEVQVAASRNQLRDVTNLPHSGVKFSEVLNSLLNVGVKEGNSRSTSSNESVQKKAIQNGSKINFSTRQEHSSVRPKVPSDVSELSQGPTDKLNVANRKNPEVLKCHDLSISIAQSSKRSKLNNGSYNPVPALPSPMKMPSWYHVQPTTLSDYLSPKKKPRMESPLTDVLKLCKQKTVLKFGDVIPRQMMSTTVKLGEGVYGEVYQAQTAGLTVAIKIVPVDGKTPVNYEHQKTLTEIVPEILITLKLSNLRQEKMFMAENFVPIHKVSLVKGKYPAKLLREWDSFAERKGTENEKPDFLGSNQLFIVYQLYDCGTDLEKFVFHSTAEAKSVLLQTAYALAAAEGALEFEHRDLHWGNILINSTSEKDTIFQLFGETVRIPSNGVQAFVIDFTLSRLTKDGIAVFCDLSKDEELFTGKGDYQFDIYRKMKAETQNEWEGFHPKTNIFWLHYLAYKLVHCKVYQSKADSVKVQMLQLLKEIPKYASAQELVYECQFFNQYFCQ